METRPDILAARDAEQVGGAELQLLARGVVEGFLAGLHRSPHKGSSVEFRQHRPYVPGDDLRTLDWKVFGKSDRFFVREFEDETNARCTLLVDTSASMAFGQGEQCKFRYAQRLAACLAHLMLRQQDAVALGLFDATLRQFVPARATPRHLVLLADTLAAEMPARGRDASDFASVFRGVIPKLEQHARRGIVAVISDCFAEPGPLSRGLLQLRRCKQDVVVFHVLHRDELDFPFRGTVRFDDLESTDRREIDAGLLRRRYMEKLAAFRRELAAACGHARADLVPVVTDESLTTALRQYLLRRSRSVRGSKGIA